MSKIFLINVLPGLGKTYLEENNDNFIDYQGWLDRKGKPYSHTQRALLNPIVDISKMISELSEDVLTQNIFIMSAVLWDDMRFNAIKADIWVHMNEGQYNCEEVKLRGRPKLCERFGERLIEWNDRQLSYSNSSNRYILDTMAYIDKSELEKMCKTSPGIQIEEGEVEIDDDDSIFEKHMEQINAQKIKQDEESKERAKIRKDKENAAPLFTRRQKSKVFNFAKVSQQYYIIGERAVIVFQLASRDTYCYWNILGVEDHRLISSAKGPFNEDLYVEPRKPWSDYRVSEEDFLRLINMNGDQIKKLWAEYSTDWFLNMQEIAIFRV